MPACRQQSRKIILDTVTLSAYRYVNVAEVGAGGTPPQNRFAVLTLPLREGSEEEEPFA
jgi:hypothetical protein